MDNVTRQKYLNALIKTIDKVETSVFSTRVNASKNDYADWIRKNLADETLARSISSIYDKAKVIEVLKQAAQSASTTVSAPAQTSTFASLAMQSAPKVSQPQVSQVSAPQVSQQVSQSIPQKQSPAQAFAQTVQASSNAASAADAQRSKYLGALVKTINALSDEVFSQRVNASNNQYADWVLKNMHDQELYSRLKQVNNKNKMLELLSSEISTASQPRSTLTQVVQAASPASQVSPVSAPVAPAVVSQVAPVPVAAPVAKKKVDNATESKYLNALIKTINGLSDEVFATRVNSSKNEYADWILKNVGDEPLYDSLRAHTDKASLIGILKSDIQSLQSAPVSAPAVASQMAPVSAPAVSSAAASQVVAHAVSASPALASASNEPIIIKTTSTLPESGVDQKISAHDLFKKLKESRDARVASGKPAPKVTSVLKKQNVSLSRNYNQKIDLVKMSAKEIIEELKLIDYSQKDIAVEEESSLVKKVVKRIKTGVPGFDDLLGAGIPAGSVVLASGGPGSGKTTFCIQMLGWAAERGEKCLFISLEESAERLIEHMESYGLNPKKYLAEGTLVIQQQDPFRISRSIEALLAHGRGELLIDIDSIMDIIPKGFKPDRVVIDSLSAIASAFNESNTAYRIYVNQLINLLSKTGATSFLITEVQGIENIGHGLVEEFLADGVIVFYNLQKGNIKQSALEVLKMRAVNHEKKIVPFEFVEGKGLVVYPLEKVFV